MVIEYMHISDQNTSGVFWVLYLNKYKKGVKEIVYTPINKV